MARLGQSERAVPKHLLALLAGISTHPERNRAFLARHPRRRAAGTRSRKGSRVGGDPYAEVVEIGRVDVCAERPLPQPHLQG